jgi:hypothetical protein
MLGRLRFGLPGWSSPRFGFGLHPSIHPSIHPDPNLLKEVVQWTESGFMDEGARPVLQIEVFNALQTPFGAFDILYTFLKTTLQNAIPN